MTLLVVTPFVKNYFPKDLQDGTSLTVFRWLHKTHLFHKSSCLTKTKLKSTWIESKHILPIYSLPPPPSSPFLSAFCQILDCKLHASETGPLVFSKDLCTLTGLYKLINDFYILKKRSMPILYLRLEGLNARMARDTLRASMLPWIRAVSSNLYSALLHKKPPGWSWASQSSHRTLSTSTTSQGDCFKERKGRWL